MKLVRKIINISLIIVLVLAVSGCANKEASPIQKPTKQHAVENAADKEKAVMDNFNALMQKKDVTIPEIIKFNDDHIAAVSKANASTMVIGLEKVQHEKLTKMQDKFADNEAVQKIIAKSYQNGIVNSISSIENKDVKDLLVESQNSGYKVETAEGMYFPVIDYSFYKKYQNAVTRDIAAFIDIMAIESDKTPIKDAGLMISWAEILKRATTQERFIKEYNNSAKIEDMRQLLKRYATFALYGANNTPLFSYDTKQMVPEAKQTYLETMFDVNHGSFSKAMIGYLAVLKKSGYRLTNEVQEYRNKVTEEIR
ncbi:hypothetical protein [Sporomusa malonica]|uniref:SurA N-terminal domain-containing protein n=1 Tax=Sporomusa malonica TaxID=112901 RepID=A0A1W2DJK8_9FIRM|nr:hypothetical protein [Sporomusa malonica]SMC97711.1 hypothetical protein SAMN04488500_11666 [Sporomusa malonica]